jgi:hypothetical protein
MPAPQLHLTFGDLVQHNPGVPSEMRKACAAEPVYARFGSIFHDLPYYYAPMVFEAVRYGLGAPALDEPWGYRVHCVQPDRLVASYIRAARTVPALSDQERLSLVGGLLSHCAIDLAMHPLVNYCARRDVQRYGGHESTHHRVTEKYQALFLHLWRFGDDSIGTPAFAERARIAKRGTSLTLRIEPSIVYLAVNAYRGAYGTAPAALQFCRWVRNFRQFGILLSSPLVAKNSVRCRTDALRERYFQNEVFDCREYFAAAEKRLGKLSTLAYDYYVAGDFSPQAEEAFCRASGIDDLAEPKPVDIPLLPYLDPVRGKVKKPPAMRKPRFRLPRVTLRRKKGAPTAAVS